MSEQRDHRYLSNSAWLFANNAVSSVMGLLVLSVVARLLGPTEYGYYAYVFSIATLFSVLGHMGLDGLMQRDLVEAKDHGRQAMVMGTAGGLRFAGYALGALVCLGMAFFVPDQTPTEKWLFLCACLFVLATPLPILPETWLRARAEARYAAMARLIGNLIGGVAKIGLVLAGFGVVWVGAAQVGTVLVVFAVVLAFYLWRGGPRLSTLRFDRAEALTMLGESWRIFAGSLLAVIYLKIDLVMLRWISGAEEAGVYAVASRLSEVPYILAATIVTTIFPRLIELRKTDPARFNERLQVVFQVMTALAFGVLALIALLGQPAVRLIFGADFTAAGPILQVHMLAMPFIYMRYVFSRWMIIERFTTFSVVSQGAGAAANVALNLLLIPAYGGIGAAVATVISYACASYLVLMTTTRTRPVFTMMSKALVTPWRGLSALSKLRKNKGFS